MARSKQLSRSHKDYWKGRVKKLPYKDKNTGKSELASDYSVRLSYLGRREYFSLHSANEKIACDMAREIDCFLRANGWELTLSKYKPKAQVRAEIETVGDLIEVSKAKAEVRPMTLKHIMERSEGLSALLAVLIQMMFQNTVLVAVNGIEVDKVKLSVLTADSVLMWRKSQLEKLNPAERKSKEKLSIACSIKLAHFGGSVDCRVLLRI